ncbi:hypothetical protein RPMA_03325 [Tardiphaga alba]|uniref:DUF6894 domain-containing protein n=1 Tax=Tardiphaga alba TaxID=340268 RepID=A0ABX8A676_9BRAD|nr:hypothetical protein [Tardiphaga alba]QUS37998.1 hypothetical protein RPMA_03325 [Tardiphaga alba]
MPRFFFDLVDGKNVSDETGQELRNEGAAKHVAEKLARDIYKIRPELRGNHFAIKVRNADGEEVHRAQLTAEMYQ